MRQEDRRELTSVHGGFLAMHLATHLGLAGAFIQFRKLFRRGTARRPERDSQAVASPGHPDTRIQAEVVPGLPSAAFEGRHFNEKGSEMGSAIKGKLVNRSTSSVWALMSVEDENDFHWEAYVLIPGTQSPDDMDVDAVKAWDSTDVIFNDMGIYDSDSSAAKPWWKFGSWPGSSAAATASLTDKTSGRIEIVVTDGVCLNKAEGYFTAMGRIEYKAGPFGGPIK